MPLIADPVVGGSMFVGLQHVWRTQDNGGDQDFLDAELQLLTRATRAAVRAATGSRCGDRPGEGDLTSTFYGNDRVGHYVVAPSARRATRGTLWAGTRIGRVFVSKNADAADGPQRGLQPHRHRRPRRAGS